MGLTRPAEPQKGPVQVWTLLEESPLTSRNERILPHLNLIYEVREDCGNSWKSIMLPSPCLAGQTLTFLRAQPDFVQICHHQL